MISGVTAKDFKMRRHTFDPWLAHFAEKSAGRLSAQGLALDIVERDRQLWEFKPETWAGPQMVALTRVCVGEDVSVYIDACAGSAAEDWREALDMTIRAWARAQGGKRVFSMARPGWSRWAKTQGYRELHREMMVEV